LSDEVLVWLSVWSEFQMIYQMYSVQCKNWYFQVLRGGQFLKVFFQYMGNTLQQWDTHTHPFNGRLSGTTRVSRYQKGKTNLDFTEARDSEWQWHRPGHMQVCTSLQTDSHAWSTFYRPDALHADQPTASN